MLCIICDNRKLPADSNTRNQQINVSNRLCNKFSLTFGIGIVFRAIVCSEGFGKEASGGSNS